MSLVTPRKGYKSVPWLFGKEIEIPEEWEVKKLDSICKFTQGIQIPYIEMNRDIGKNTVRYLYIQDFESNHNQKFVENIYPEKMVTENDLVMANTGYYAGKSFKGKNGVLSNNAFKITFDNEVIVKDFLFDFLQSLLFNIQKKKII